MGLDMYIRRISKPHLDATKTYRETELGEYRLILDEDATVDSLRCSIGSGTNELRC